MEKTNFSILLFLFSVTSLCKSQSDDYNYDPYNYDQNNYDEYDYNEKYDYYGHQNLLAPAPLPIQPPPQPGNYIFVCKLVVLSLFHALRTFPRILFCIHSRSHLL